MTLTFSGLDGGTFIVTGHSGGVGLKVTELLLLHGASVVGIDRSGREVPTPSSKSGDATLLTFAQDLSDLDALRPLVRSIVSETGPVSGLVHCAGHDLVAPVQLTKGPELIQLFSVHAAAPLIMLAELSGRNQARSGFSCVLISSLAAHEGARGHTAYAAAKGALEGYLKSAAAELVSRDMRLNAIVPGVVETSMSRKWLQRLSDSKLEELKASYPLGLGDPASVANMVMFLLASESSWVTGQRFFLDGGRLISS